MKIRFICQNSRKYGALQHMNFFKKTLLKLRKTVRYSASNPENFDEIWSFQSNPIRIISLVIIVLVIVVLASGYLLSGFFSGLEGDVSIDRKELEEQDMRIKELNDKIEAQENYIANIQMILSGEVPVNLDSDTITNILKVDPDTLKTGETDAEKLMADEVKNDSRTPKTKKNDQITYFGSPVLGVISQKFEGNKHPGIDVVTSKDKTVKACLAGTVIYSGYTRKDGYIVIIEHGGEFVSVYKHNKTALKKIGSKVQLGDPISIVGNSGENTDGPHLHFELWHKQMPVNPVDYIRFTK